MTLDFLFTCSKFTSYHSTNTTSIFKQSLVEPHRRSLNSIRESIIATKLEMKHFLVFIAFCCISFASANDSISETLKGVLQALGGILEGIGDGAVGGRRTASAPEGPANMIPNLDVQASNITPDPISGLGTASSFAPSEGLESVEGGNTTSDIEPETDTKFCAALISSREHLCHFPEEQAMEAMNRKNYCQGLSKILSSLGVEH